jgi:hypothetical protein
MPETLLEMVERHLCEGAERIVLQRALIDRLEKVGGVDMLPTARLFLEEMIVCQNASRRLRWEIEETDRFKHPDIGTA